MRVFLLVAVLLFGRCPGSGAQGFLFAKSFPESALVLTTGVMLTGTLRLYPDDEVVSVTCANDRTYTLPARLVKGFAVKDPLPDQLGSPDPFLRSERVFRVFPVARARDDTSRLPAWGFYEQLSQGPGPVLLLRHEKAHPNETIILHTPDALGNPNPLTITFCTGTTDATFYLRTAAGSVVRLRKPQHLLRLFLPHQAALLRTYARENGLRYANPNDLAFLVNYVNTLPKHVP